MIAVHHKAAAQNEAITIRPAAIHNFSSRQRITANVAVIIAVKENGSEKPSGKSGRSGRI
jgi:hypothetical protein